MTMGFERDFSLWRLRGQLFAGNVTMRARARSSRHAWVDDVLVERQANIEAQVKRSTFRKMALDSRTLRTE